MIYKYNISIGAFVLLLAVAAGAFGSHGLQPYLTERLADVWDTAVLYHLIHGLGLLLIVTLDQQRPSRLFSLAWLIMLAGVILFSGSLYLLVLTELRVFGPVTPIGGIALMLSWLLVSWAGLRKH
ncbi:MAG: DUF423 domain-containing protein [Aquisalimonadaceae bacterium]